MSVTLALNSSKKNYVFVPADHNVAACSWQKHMLALS